jgi:hypothetical protein
VLRQTIDTLWYTFPLCPCALCTAVVHASLGRDIHLMYRMAGITMLVLLVLLVLGIFTCQRCCVRFNNRMGLWRHDSLNSPPCGAATPVPAIGPVVAPQAHENEDSDVSSVCITCL